MGLKVCCVNNPRLKFCRRMDNRTDDFNVNSNFTKMSQAILSSSSLNYDINGKTNSKLLVYKSSNRGRNFSCSKISNSPLKLSFIERLMSYSEVIDIWIQCHYAPRPHSSLLPLPTQRPLLWCNIPCSVHVLLHVLPPCPIYQVLVFICLKKR